MPESNTVQENSSVNTSAPLLNPSDIPGSRSALDQFVSDTEAKVRAAGGHMDTHEGMIFENIVQEVRSILDGAKSDASALGTYKDLLARAHTLVVSTAGKGHQKPNRPSAKKEPEVISSSEIIRSQNNPETEAPLSLSQIRSRLKEKSPENKAEIQPSSPIPPPEHKIFEPKTIGASISKPPPIPPIVKQEIRASVPLQNELRSNIGAAAISLVPAKVIDEEYDKHMDYLFGGSGLRGKGKLPHGIAESEAGEIFSESLDARTLELRNIDLKDLETLRSYLEEATKKTGLIPTRGERVETFIKRMIAKDLSRTGS